MTVLAIESSCDETAAAVVDAQGQVHGEVVASQVEDHARFGGVVPELAARCHLQNIIPVVTGALSRAGCALPDLDGVAVTQGPGLVGALLVGQMFGKSLALAHRVPLVGVDHLEAHLLAARICTEQGGRPEFPYIGLLVSGGHTSLFRVRAPDDITQLSSTRDDAVGEAFDKTAKLLGLGYPGGPSIDRLAAVGDAGRFALPVPMRGRPGIDFSFSGLKTAVAQQVARSGVPDGELPVAGEPQPSPLADLCASFQAVVVEALLARAFRACQHEAVDALVIAGGVAANRGLKQAALRQGAERGVTVWTPPPRLCTDNAAMVGYVGALKLAAGFQDGLDLDAYSRSAGFRKGKIAAR